MRIGLVIPLGNGRGKKSLVTCQNGTKNTGIFGNYPDIDKLESLHGQICIHIHYDKIHDSKRYKVSFHHSFFGGRHFQRFSIFHLIGLDYKVEYQK